MDPTKDHLDPLERCTFPKYRGALWEHVIQRDEKYVSWLISVDGPDISDALAEALELLLEEYYESY